MVTLGTGSLALAIGIYGFFSYGKEVRSGFVALIIVGASTLLLTVLPNEPKLAKGMTYGSVVFEISSAAAQSIVDGSLVRDSLSPPSCDKVQTSQVQCVRDSKLLPSAIATAISIASCIVIAARLTWLLARGKSGRHLLDEVWRAFAVGTLTIFAQSVVKWSSAGRLSLIDVAWTLVLYVVLIATSVIGFSPRLRLHLTGWIASRGAASSSASQMAQLLGADSIAEDVMKLSQTLLRCVASNALRPSDLKGTIIANDIYERTRPAQIGEIDAFVSHS